MASKRNSKSAQVGGPSWPPAWTSKGSLKIYFGRSAIFWTPKMASKKGPQKEAKVEGKLASKGGPPRDPPISFLGFQHGLQKGTQKEAKLEAKLASKGGPQGDPQIIRFGLPRWPPKGDPEKRPSWRPSWPQGGTPRGPPQK